MANLKLTSRYANSLMQIAKEKNSVEAIFTDMVMIADTIKGSKEFEVFLKSPIVSAENKKSIMTKIFQSKVNNDTLGFLNLLVEKGREPFLNEVCSAFIATYNNMHKIADITLITAVTATENMVNEVTQLLKQSGNYSKVAIKQEVDENLIGGFILKMDDQLLDNSIQRKLKNIKKELQR